MYIGYLLTIDAVWLARQLARADKMFPALVGAVGLPYGTGDPVFLVTGDERGSAVAAHARVSYYEENGISAAWEKFGQTLDVEDESEFRSILKRSGWSEASEVGVLVLTNLIPLHPPLSPGACGLESLTIDGTHRELNPEEVFAILKALPGSAQTAWTRRVVARKNA